MNLNPFSILSAASLPKKISSIISAKTRALHNHLNLLLILGESFKKHKEDEHFKHRWYIDQELSDKVHESLHALTTIFQTMTSFRSRTLFPLS
jgi:hypothetical protein